MSDVVKLPKRVRVSELCQRHDGQVGRQWMVTVDHNVEDCLDEGFFAQATSNLMAGDTVRVVRFKKDRLIAYMDVTVIERTFNPNNVEVRPDAKPIYISEPVPETIEEEAPDPEIYVSEDCTVEFKGPIRKWEVIGESGEVHASGISTRDEAMAIASGSAEAVA